MSGYLTRLAARTGLGQAATPSPAIAERNTVSPTIAEGADVSAENAAAPPERETAISVGPTDGPENALGQPRVTHAPAPALIDIERAAQPVAPIPRRWPDPDRSLDDARPMARKDVVPNATAGQTPPHLAPTADWPKGLPAMGDPASARQAGPPPPATVETLAPDGWAVPPSMPVAVEAPTLATPNPGNRPQPREAGDQAPAARSPEPSVEPFAAATPRPLDGRFPVPLPDHRGTGGDGVEVKIGSVSLEIIHRPASPEPPPAPPPPARRAAWAGDIGVLRRLHVRGV